MRVLPTAAFAALLLGTTIVASSAYAANPGSSGCPTATQRAESEGGTNNQGLGVRQAESEGGTNNQGLGVRQAEAEGGSNNQGLGIRRAESEARLASIDPCKR